MKNFLSTTFLKKVFKNLPPDSTNLSNSSVSLILAFNLNFGSAFVINNIVE